ncbi:VOC family protein [Tessaracoccus coleopterorum]|uniref:VOC family protein n=1 Tax=Tessaracoccus coleopterorum TaxID=2714950 RepID=UPI0018D44B24
MFRHESEDRHGDHRQFRSPPLATWWSERLGAPIVEENDGWFFVIGSIPTLAVQHVDDPTEGKNRIHLDLLVDDLAGASAELQAAGATLVGERGDESLRWITLADPQGNQFCIAGGH